MRASRRSTLVTETPANMALVRDMLRLQAKADEQFYAELERAALEKEQAHRIALASAAAAHNDVLRGAELARLRFEHELEKERKRREDEQQKEFERIRREKAERELVERKKQIEDAQRVQREEAERKRQLEEVEAKAKADAQAAAKADAEREAAAAAATKAEADKKAAEKQRQKAEQDEAARRHLEATKRTEEQARVTPGPSNAPAAPTTTITAPGAPFIPALSPEERQKRDANHQLNVEIHKRLKLLRQNMTEWAKTSPAWKTKLGDMRREIRKCVGQLTEGKGVNKEPTRKIIEILAMAQNDKSVPPVDIRMYIANFGKIDPHKATRNESQAPATFVYLMNIFAKAALSQFIDEASVSPRAADPIGVVVAQVFSSPQFQWQGLPLIDVLMAKFHVVCPVLWGIYGDESTNVGKARCGRWREEKDGPFVSDQRHSERMTGLGAGYASIALRNFEKSRSINPYPNRHYWQSLYYITSVPPQEATGTHYTVLKAMIEHYESRILDFYGRFGLLVLRRALVEYPKQTVKQNAAASALAVLPDALKRDVKMTLF